MTRLPENSEGESYPGKGAARERSEPTLEVKNLLSRRFRQGGDNANVSEGNRKQDKQTTCLD